MLLTLYQSIYAPAGVSPVPQSEHVLNIAQFRAMFPAFANVTLYPDIMLEVWWNYATCQISTCDNPAIGGKCLQAALYLMLAHLGTIFTNAAQGNMATGVATSAAIDKVSVGYAAPPYKNGWQAWLATTPYGMQLWAMLEAKAAGGFYFGGRPETLAIRKVGGYF